ncbi:thiolase-like protein [Blastocladiella britannica]|nr:thiolase-like protein [Blastocladiella britannica]
MSANRNKVYVIGVGMTKFIKPGKPESPDYPEMAREAITKALIDANITYPTVESAFVGYCYGDSTAGQRALYEVGATSIPIINVNNNCSTGSSALYLAHSAIAAGTAQVTLALGFEKMAAGSLASVWQDRANPLEPHLSVISAKHDLDLRKPMAPTIFGLAGVEYCERKGITSLDEQRLIMSKIAWKNHLHSVRNPYSQFRDEYTVEQIAKSRQVFGPLTMLQCCPTSDGSACTVLASEEFVRANNLFPQAIEIGGIAMATDSSDAFATYFTDRSETIPREAVDFGKIAGADMTRNAAARALQMAQTPISAVRVVELHDCFSANELITTAALGIADNACEFASALEQRAHGVIGRGDAGQDVTINPSGGLISKGHPLGATGLAQCAELTWQLRGWCGDRQVPGTPQVALQHNLGLGGAAVVVVYKKPAVSGADGAHWADPRNRFGYNPALVAHGVTDDDVKKVRGRAGDAAYLKSML